MQFKPDYQLSILSEEEHRNTMDTIAEELKKYVVSGVIHAYDGLEIAYEYYLAEHARGSITMVHGYTEFMAKYWEMTWYFLHMGYNVFLYDQRGHGASGRQVEDIHLAHVNQYKDYVLDLDTLMREVVQPVSGEIPLYILAHSMGGAVTMRYLDECENRISKVILTSPMISAYTGGAPEFLVRLIVRRGIRCEGGTAKFKHASTFDPNPEFIKSGDLSESRFRYNLNARIADVRKQNSSSTNSWMMETMNARKYLLKRRHTNKIRAKVLLLSAGKDTTVRCRAQMRYARMLPDCKVVTFENGKHCLFTADEKILKPYYREIFAFLDQ